MRPQSRSSQASEKSRILDHCFYATLAILILGTGTACSTVDSRISANRATFDQLPPDQQALVRTGSVSLGCGAAAVSLAYGDPRYVTYESEPLAETQVIHNYGDFMILAASLPSRTIVWHYQGTSLRRLVEGDDLTIVFDRNARVEAIEQRVSVGFHFGSGVNRQPQPTPKQQTLFDARHLAIGFDRDSARLALGAPDRSTLRTDANGQTLIWHYESVLHNRASDRTTIQDRLAITFDSNDRISAIEEKEPLDFNVVVGSRSSGQLTTDQQALLKEGQVALGFDPLSAKKALGSPDWVTLRTSPIGRELIWHFEAARHYHTSDDSLESTNPVALARYGITLAFDENGRVKAINEAIGVRAD